MTYLLPPLNPLRAFEAAARHLSFKLAAHELHVTPAAVGQQVKVLEDRLGVRLFERLHKQLVLTTAGQEYVAAVQKGFSHFRKTPQAWLGAADLREPSERDRKQRGNDYDLADEPDLARVHAVLDGRIRIR